MKLILKLFFIFILISQTTYALGSKYYQEKFDTTKKLYLGAIMSSEKKKEIEYLKKLVRYGKKLQVDTNKYERELNRLDKSIVLKNISNKKFKSATISKPKRKPKATKKRAKSYTISSVIQNKNTIVINFNKRINKKYINFTEERSGKFFYDTFKIKGSFKDASPTKLAIKGVYKIIIYQKKRNELLINFKDTQNLKTIYIINKNQIVIKVLDWKVKKWNNSYSKSKKNIQKKAKIIDNDILYPSKKTIVIDAGHGGKDGGANYKRKRFEKNITLNISKYLKKDLEKKGFKVFLTRSRDKYVKLSHRTKYANKKHADIFISIHANAAPKKRASKAHGVEAYFLSPARSARAKRVAALENKGDMTGMGWSSKNSLLTILNRAKITAANKMAIDIQKNMLYTLRKTYGRKNIRDGGVREGPFWVLVGAQMPSVLVEVGYITHPKEGYRISTRSYQKIVAKGIAKGIESYFIKN